jgi:hypothetical protein
VDAFLIPRGSQVFIGAPANPPEQSVVSAITSFLAEMGEVQEAHLIQCYLPNLPSPSRQVVVIVVEGVEIADEAAKRVARFFDDVLPKGMWLEVWPMRLSNPLLPLVRGADCCVKQA